MKDERIIVIDPCDGVQKAALIENGRLQDLLFDCSAEMPLPEDIYRARASRPLKGQGGMLVDLGDGQSGFLRQAKSISPGANLIVQVTTLPDGNKAAVVSEKVLFKSRYAIVTPGAKGRNIARSIRDEDRRAHFAALAEQVLGDKGATGIILRSSCAEAEDQDIADDIAQMSELADAVMADEAGAPGLLVPRPDAATLAWRDWMDPAVDDVIEEDGSFDRVGVWDEINKLRKIKVDLGDGAYMFIEPTSALVAVDINTGADFSPKAGLNTNMSAARALPGELRLRGLGGQITLDLAPMSKKDRQVFEQVLGAALRADKTDTALVGWTPLGHFELQRKRDRISLALLREA